ncbi:MAG TPA: hypothetical protein VHA35_01070 [Dongiaceae bacterium]|nr:hypothetical protein [Dongiaceae bacterium]
MQARLGPRRSVAEGDREEAAGDRAEPPASAPAGSYICPVCGETVRAADLGASLFHQRPNHKAGDRRG